MIWAYVAEESSERVATQLLSRIQAAIANLGDFPRAGAPRGALAPGLRTIFHGRYAIYYTASDTEAVVVRVLHGARDIAAVAQDGGFSEVEAKKE